MLRSWCNLSFKLVAIFISIISLTSCSGGGSCSNCAKPTDQLVLVAPSILPSLANKTGINYMGVYNPSNLTVSGISYSLGQQVGSGNSITLDPQSAANCASIEAKASCYLKLSNPESTIAGGTIVSATSNGAEAALPLAIGVQQVPYTESADADGVGLYFYPKAQYSSNGVPFILVTAVVQSPNAGDINSIELVDESGNIIPNQVVTSSNSGAGKPILQLGDVVEISLPLPQGVGLSQNIKVQVSYQTLSSSAVNTTAGKLNQKSLVINDTNYESTGTIIYNLTTQGNNINLQFTPNQVFLTGINPVQYGYLYNIGSLTASQIQVSSSSPNVSITAADAILNGQRVIKVTYELIDTSVGATSTNVTVTGQNPSGQTQTSSGTTGQNIDPSVVPLSANLTLSSYIANLNKENPYRIITVTNSGTAIATNLILPTLSNPVYMNSPTTCTPGESLAPQESCIYTIAYSGADNNSLENVLFTYTDGVNIKTTPLAISWLQSVQLAYITNATNSPQTEGVYQCSVSNTGDISNCNIQNATTNLNSPFNLSFATVNGSKYLYVAESGNGVAKCSLSNYGDITTCTESNNYNALVLAGFAGDTAAYITFGFINGVQYAYIATSTINNVYTCQLNNSGDFTACNLSINLTVANGISVNYIESVPYLYVVGQSIDNLAAGILRYQINLGNGQPESSLTYDLVATNIDNGYPSDDFRGGIALAMINSVNNVYSGLADTEDGYPVTTGISMCSLTSAGIASDSNCAADEGQVITDLGALPYSITFAVASGNYTLYSYFGLYNGASGIYKCTVDPTIGTLNCTLQSGVVDGGDARSIVFSPFLPGVN